MAKEIEKSKPTKVAKKIDSPPVEQEP